MKHSMKVAQCIGFVVVSIVGTLVHFLYEWFGNAAWIAPLAAVNESTWEHQKLLFWPAFFYAIAQSFFFKDYKYFWYVKMRGILLGLVLIPLLFFSYNGIIAHSPSWFNISNFFISVAACFLYEMRLFKAGQPRGKYTKGAFAVLCVIAILFGVFTFLTPEIALFEDPHAGTYGI